MPGYRPGWIAVASEGNHGKPCRRQEGQHAATKAFWDSLRGGDFEACAAAIEALTAATLEYPEEEEFFLLPGLAQLWRVAEPKGLESLDLAGLLEAITASEQALERAYSLCPTDHRIPAWLGPIKVRSGRNSGDQAPIDEGFALLEQGVEHYPGFVLFSKFLVYADLPADDPDFLLAVEAVRDNTSNCGEVTELSQDPACRNHYRAAHNLEGAMVFTGDMYAKAQDREAALEAYQNAQLADEWAQWDCQDLLQERIDTLDARMAAHATTGFPLDDHEVAWEATNQCSLCHRE